MEMSAPKCSWFSMDTEAAANLSYMTGEIRPESPTITLQHTQGYRYEPPGEESTNGLSRTLLPELPVAAFEAYFKHEAEVYERVAVHVVAPGFWDRILGTLN